MYKAVIFDLNGVFLESRYLSDRFEETYGVPNKEFFQVMKGIMDQVRLPDAPPAFSLWESHLKKWNVGLNETGFFNFWFSGEHLVPELVEYTRQLREQGTKVFILSNNFKERTTYYREQFSEIFSNIDRAYFSWETGHVKPAPEAFKALLNEQHIAPGQTVYFDDSEKNIQIARELGIQSFIWHGLEAAKRIIETNNNSREIHH